MKTPHVINGRVGFPDENFPFPEKLNYPCIDCIKMDCDAVSCTEKYYEAYSLALSYITYFADEEQDAARMIIRTEINIWEHPLKDGPYPVEDFPPYKKIDQFRSIYADTWQDGNAPKPEGMEERTILRFTKQETKPEKQIMKTVKLTKLREAENPLHPHNIPDGYVKVGDFMDYPKVDESFCVGYHWSTSTVQEILSENTFRTHNSIYKWELIEQETKEEPKTESQEGAFKKDLAVEITARFIGSSRGLPIEKRGFVDGALWAFKFLTRK